MIPLSAFAPGSRTQRRTLGRRIRRNRYCELLEALVKLSFKSSSFALALMLGTLSIVGCGGAMSLPDSVASIQAAGPPLSGIVLGGHAPIVGAHVYLLQPGTSGIGSLATSILGNNGATSANGYTITADVNDPNVVAGSKYVTTDSGGGFSLTGAYTCVVGQPVYIYAWGGTPSTTAVAAQPTYNVTQVVVSNAASSSPTYTVTVTPSELLYTGENIAIQGFNGSFKGLNGTQVVLPSGLTTTTFEFTSSAGGSGVKDGPLTNGQISAGLVTPSPQGNNAIVQLATLGNCPSSGNFSTPGNGALSYVYMNEVSTVAAAYTFQPFTSAANNSAWAIGSSGSTQGLLGIANAAANAAQLYNIQGGGQTSTVYDGEGHLANALTVNGNGIIPQATIDTLGNILAACVDSAPNGSNAGANGLSAQCSTLFTTATDDGSLLGTQPIDTATAAINIARYPAGNHAASTGANPNFVANIFAIPTGDVPFTPNLANAPNDFTIVINYPFAAVGGYAAANPTLEQAESVAVDALGQVFISAHGNGSSQPPTVVRWSPLGVPNAGPFSAGSSLFGYVSIDGSNNAWASQTTGAGSIEEFIYNPTTNGITTATYGSGYINPRPLVTTQSGDALFIASDSPNGGNYQLFEYGPLGASISGSPYSLSSTTLTTNDFANHGAIAASGDLWFTSERSNQIGLVTPTGTAVFSPSVVAGTQPEVPAVDHLGNAWVPIQSTASQIDYVTPTGISSTLSSASTGANLVATFGAAVDGNGNIWFANRCGFNGACTNGPGTNSIVELSGLTHTAISPSTNYYPEAQYPASATTFTRILSDPVNLAIDPSGNVWTTNYLGSEVTEMIGAAAPVVTPLSTAAGTNALGVTP